MSALERYGPWALVTGASDGIGRALARRIAANAVVGGLGRGGTVVPGLRAKLLTAALATMPRAA